MMWLVIKVESFPSFFCLPQWALAHEQTLLEALYLMCDCFQCVFKSITCVVFRYVLQPRQ